MDEPLEPGILKGVAPSTIEKLLKTGYSTLKSVAVTPVREIAERAGMGMDTAFKVSTPAMEKVDPGFQRRGPWRSAAWGARSANTVSRRSRSGIIR